MAPLSQRERVRVREKAHWNDRASYAKQVVSLWLSSASARGMVKLGSVVRTDPFRGHAPGGDALGPCVTVCSKLMGNLELGLARRVCLQPRFSFDQKPIPVVVALELFAQKS